MKPDEARRRRKLVEQMRAARGEALDAYLRGEKPGGRVVPDLIPDEAERGRAVDVVRRLAAQADRTARGSRARSVKMDQLVLAVARLVAVERVLALDPLERAGLTPRRLGEIADGIRPADLTERLAVMHGESRTVAP